MEIGQIIAQYGLPIAALGLVSIYFYRELKDRIAKSEAREDKMITAFERLADAAEANNKIMEALVERPSGRKK